MENSLHAFLRIISDGRPLTPGFITELYPRTDCVRYRKGEYWLGRGRRNPEIAFIIEGSAMSFRFEENTQNVTTLWNTNEIIIEGSTLFPKRHQDDRVIFLEDSEMLILAVRDIGKLQAEFADARYLVNQMMVKNLARMEALYYLMKFQPPNLRLVHTLEKYARPFNLLTAVQKASYLGISKQSFYNLL
ncbi:Crp/Fnr family transcriptional regulator [Sphingobacterium spiritivorum]|uniref:Crp/Fnr family transcriptional regulator n=1 Tax=Sphingobacterium spiritivorum TaxID=258 RepID=UPI003DA324B0